MVGHSGSTPGQNFIYVHLDCAITKYAASNKIQGLAAIRALGMLIAGLPCLPWFIDSGWNLAFGVLPAKAFWVASDHGTWWLYPLVGVHRDAQPHIRLTRRSPSTSSTR